jgi:hypothetical protein
MWYGVPYRGQNQKFLRIRVPHAKKTPQNKKSAKLENFLKIRFFYPKEGPRGKEIEFSKSFPIWLIFCSRGFFGMGNSNPKKFFDFDHEKVPF